MIVARDTDLETVEKSGAYAGLYFVLGGTVPLMEAEPEKRIRLKALVEKAAAASDSLKEIILSLNATPDGEHTANLVHSALKDGLSGRSIKITVLGRGLSTGAELEYVDGETIRSALKNRG